MQDLWDIYILPIVTYAFTLTLLFRNTVHIVYSAPTIFLFQYPAVYLAAKRRHGIGSIHKFYTTEGMCNACNIAWRATVYNHAQRTRTSKNNSPNPDASKVPKTYLMTLKDQKPPPKNPPECAFLCYSMPILFFHAIKILSHSAV